MTTTAKKSRDLTKRVRRFLLRERRRDEILANLLDCLVSCQDVYLFGGVLRDIALFGISKLEADIDLVYTGTRDAISAVVRTNSFKVEKNKFGGARVETRYWFVDVWAPRIRGRLGRVVASTRALGRFLIQRSQTGRAFCMT